MAVIPCVMIAVRKCFLLLSGSCSAILRVPGFRYSNTLVLREFDYRISPRPFVKAKRNGTDPYSLSLRLAGEIVQAGGVPSAGDCVSHPPRALYAEPRSTRPGAIIRMNYEIFAVPRLIVVGVWIGGPAINKLARRRPPILRKAKARTATHW